MHEFEKYIAWCKQKGYKPSNPKALKIYILDKNHTNSKSYNQKLDLDLYINEN